MELKKIEHIIFRAGITIKGIIGLLELIAGLILFVISSQSLTNLVNRLFEHEIAQDPSDLIANFIFQIVQNLSHNKQLFGAVFLCIHGLIKIGIVYALLSEKGWAYPIAGIILGLLALYQIIRFTFTHSIILFILTLLDCVIIILIYNEYTMVKNRNSS